MFSVWALVFSKDNAFKHFKIQEGEEGAEEREKRNENCIWTSMTGKKPIGREEKGSYVSSEQLQSLSVSGSVLSSGKH